MEGDQEENSKPRLLLISGTGEAAIAAMNVYMKELSSNFEISVIEERNFTIKKMVRLLRSIWKRYGFRRVLDVLLLRACFSIRDHWKKSSAKSYVPDLSVVDLSEPSVAAYIKNRNPSVVITNGCSVVKESLLKLFPELAINVHPGIAPRYRGIGNFWAFFERNQEQVGVTVHRLVKGIDAGERLVVEAINFRMIGVSFDEIDSIALSRGAFRAARYLLDLTRDVPEEYRELDNRYYSYPGLSHYLRARDNYHR